MSGLRKFFKAVHGHGKATVAGDEAKPKPIVGQPLIERASGYVTEERLERALNDGELQLYYQPLTDIKTGLIVGAEALIRWNHPESGLMLPAAFIPSAEQSHAIIDIGEWVLREACGRFQEYRNAGFLDLIVSVNVSVKQFESMGFFDEVTTALKRSHLPAANLVLEITETTAMKNVEQSVPIMRRLHELGVKIAIDDFGTGYSSLAALKQFPLDELKIDRSFVRTCTSDPDDAAIVMAVISLANGMGLTAVAEGVETQRQLEYLRSLDCQIMQGFLGGAAMPADAFGRVMRGEDDPFKSIAALP